MNVLFEGNTKQGKDEWLTPPSILKALGDFDLDPCSPINRPWDTAKKHYTIEDNGLNKKWEGRVWCNPPYGDEAEDWIIVEDSNIPPHQQRVIDEHKELKDRSFKLSAFILDNPTFLTLSEEEKARLRKQNELMGQYCDVLSERIASF